MSSSDSGTDWNSFFLDYGLHLPSRTIYAEHDTSGDCEGEVGPQLAAKIIKEFYLCEYHGTAPIEIILNSPGGSYDDGMGVYDIITGSPCHTTITVYGQASSMGAVILQAADRRQMSSNSYLMLHYGQMGYSDTVRNVERLTEFQKRRKEDMISLFSGVTQTTKSYIRRKLDPDWYLTAQQAYEEGLIDRII